VPGVNRFTLDATLVARDALRYTPAGIPAIECTLEHRSLQDEAGGRRKVECEMHGIAFGEIATALGACALGSYIRCDGFIARRYRTGTSVALHVTGFEHIVTTEGN
jgi:primosomal replication protein N